MPLPVCTAEPSDSPMGLFYRDDHAMPASSQQAGYGAATARAAVACDRADQLGTCCMTDQPGPVGASSSRKRDAPGPCLSPDKSGPNGMSAICCKVLCCLPVQMGCAVLGRAILCSFLYCAVDVQCCAATSCMPGAVLCCVVY